ncbi:MAG: hypothetical protein ACMVO3_23440 [Thalassobaculum sp.]
MVGQICAGWASLELSVDTEIWQLSGMKQAPLAACVTNELTSIHTKIRALLSLCRVWGIDKKVIKDLSSFSQRLYSIAEKRNRAVHDPWVVTEDGHALGQWNLSREKDGFVSYIRPVSFDELNAVSAQISDKIMEFQKIRERLHEFFEPLRENPPSWQRPIPSD